METIAIKQELVRLIESENDITILQAIKDLLNPIQINPILEEKLISRALKADEDIKARRLYSEDEVIQMTNHSVGK